MSCRRFSYIVLLLSRMGNTLFGTRVDALLSLPGQRTSACTCAGEDHPGPDVSKGRGVPEIDAIEVSIVIGSPLSASPSEQPRSVMLTPLFACRARPICLSPVARPPNPPNSHPLTIITTTVIQRLIPCKSTRLLQNGIRTRVDRIKRRCRV